MSRNTYTLPVLDPTMAISPLIETPEPNSCEPEPSSAVSFVTWAQAPPTSRKMYAAPLSLPRSSSCRAPTTAVSPLIDTSEPNSS